MDMGCYAVSTLCGAFGSDPEECVSATARSVKKAGEENCDEAFRASFRFPNGAIGTVEVDLSKAKWWIPKIELPKVIVEHRA
jgi:predicted dehydrogenase